MPTLAQHACAEPPLHQLDGSTNLVSIEKPKSGSAS